MQRRRVIQLAKDTLIITLPQPWARSVGILKGSEVEVSCDNSALVIHAPRQLQIQGNALEASDEQHHEGATEEVDRGG